MKLKNYLSHCLTGLWSAVLLVYFGAVVYLNLNPHPAFFCTDMYSDMMYAVSAWEKCSVFPAGWIFGNQLYAVSTPVIAAFFYGITGHPGISMGLASIFMTLGIFLSLQFMLSALGLPLGHRLFAMAALMSLVVFFGDAYYTVNGWQLFFTMCSYYGCYLMTAFLAFGCWLHSRRAWSSGFRMVLALTCLLCFGTGMQSLRQTAVMICPLVAGELLCIAGRFFQKKPLLTPATACTGCLTAANLLGLVWAKIAAPAQVEIFGKLQLMSLSQIFTRLSAGVQNAVSMFWRDAGAHSIPLFFLFAALWVAVCLVLLLKKDRKGLLCLILFTCSAGVIFVIDVATTMVVRRIYYFMLYPLLAVLAVLIYAHGGKLLRGALLVVFLILFIFNCQQKLQPAIQAAEAPDHYEEVADFLQQQGITTIYSGWNCGEKIALAADFTIRAGFWDSYRTPFMRVNYLCDPEIFHASPQTCAYIFAGAASANMGKARAEDLGCPLKLLKYFPKSGIYVFVADENLMYG